jgi:signal transduction histidine kinase
MRPSIQALNRLSMLVIGIIGISLLSAALYLRKELDQMDELRDNVLDWNAKAVGLQVLSIEYVLLSGEQRLQRWRVHYESMAQLAGLFVQKQHAYPQIEPILAHWQQMPALLDLIVRAEDSPGVRRNYILNFETTIHAMTLSSGNLLHHIADEEFALYKRIVWVIEGIIALALILLIFQARLFQRWVMQPLDKLANQIRILGLGDLKHPVEGSDTLEVDAIARQLDNTRLQLAELTISRGELESEVDKRTQTLLQRSRALELANRELEELSYSVSHDLRSPLRAIDGYIAILLDEHHNELDLDGERLLSNVSTNARKMGQLIDDLLAFVHSRRLRLKIEDVDMEELVHEVWQALTKQRGQGKFRFESKGLGVVQGDRDALSQVWSKLFENAIKFSRMRDEACIEVLGRRHSDHHEFSVSDNGVGFNPEFSGKLFVLFQRLHGMDEFEGTGVGLALVKRFVQKHGGRVSAKANLDQGACFSFTLPFQILVREDEEVIT